MGRHNASYIAARQGVRTGSTAHGAAKYVGRVGALALAMGVGAAVAGGTALASAEGTGQDASNVGGAAPAAAGPTTSQTEATAAGTDADAPASGSPAAKTPGPSPLDVPKMVFDGGVATDDPTTDAATRTRSGSRATSRSHGDQPAKPPTAGRNTVTSIVRTKTVDAAVGTYTAAKSLAVTPPPAQKVDGGQRIVIAAATVTARQAVTTVAPAPAAPRLVSPIATVVSGVLNALGFAPAATTGGSPAAPVPILLAALQLIRREIDHFVMNVASAAAYYQSAQMHAVPSAVVGIPDPADEAPTAYGDVGKWMLQPGGQISNYGGQPYGGRTLLEPVNVIIVDSTSTSPAKATGRLNAAVFWAGFPAQPIHSTGFTGRIDDVTYGQQPTGLLQGFSDNLFIFPNDHGRIFGPDLVQSSTGYVWSGAFSTETLGIYDFLPTHSYVSSDMARTALAVRLIFSGQATYVGMVPLNNAVDTATTTTGDHDGYAVVLRLT